MLFAAHGCRRTFDYTADAYCGQTAFTVVSTGGFRADNSRIAHALNQELFIEAVVLPQPQT